MCRSQWPGGLRRGCAAARLLGLRVRISPAVWISVSYECCVLSSRGLCYRPILRSEESYRLCCVCVWGRNFYSEEAWDWKGLLRRSRKKWTSRLQGLWRHAVSISNSLLVPPPTLLMPLCPNLYLCFQGLTFFVQDITLSHFQFKACVFFLLLLLLPQLYNSSWVLACSIIPLRGFLSCAFCFQLFTPIFLKSSLTSSSHLNLGLPFGLVACGFHL